MTEQPKIVCLCGSSRFVQQFAVTAWEMEKAGSIVLSLHLLPAWYTSAAHHLAEREGVAERMDELHLRKIDLADSIFVMNVDGYIGDSTRNEIAYAWTTGKRIDWLEGTGETFLQDNACDLGERVADLATGGQL